MKFNKRDIITVILISLSVIGWQTSKFFSFQFSSSLAADASFQQRLDKLQQQRQTAWATQYNGWDFEYTGRDTCADNVPNHLRCDNPIDDDWGDSRVAQSSFVLNYRPSGYIRNDFMFVDRVSNHLDHLKTGNIWRRDELLTNDQGATVEFSVRIGANSDKDGFEAWVVDDVGSIIITLSPNKIKILPSGATVNFDTTNTLHTYRIVKQPNSLHVSLYLDDDNRSVLEGDMQTNFHAGSAFNIDFPYILIGDNNQAEGINAIYTFDYLRYRRGAFPPGIALTSLPARTPPNLPPNVTSVEQFNHGFDGTFLPWQNSLYKDYSKYRKAWKQLDGGIVDYSTFRANSATFVDGVPDLKNKGGITIEARLKVLPESKDRGFILTYLDGMGALSVTLSPKKIESFLGLKPRGFVTVPMDTTNDFHTYRLVRPTNSLYSYLYIDNDPIPAVVDYHLDGSTEVGTIPVLPYLQFGYFGYPVPYAKTHVLIDYVRWHDGANAPQIAPDPPAPDLTCSNDRGQTFVQGPCTDSVAIVQWNLVARATACTASAGPGSSKFNGIRPTSSTETIESITATRTYTITCSGPGGSGSDSVIINAVIPLEIQRPSPISVLANRDFSKRVHPVGGIPPYKWRAVNALYFSDNGFRLKSHYLENQSDIDAELLGKPAKRGTHILEIELKDARGFTVTKKISVIVR